MVETRRRGSVEASQPLKSMLSPITPREADGTAQPPVATKKRAPMASDSDSDDDMPVMGLKKRKQQEASPETSSVPGTDALLAVGDVVTLAPGVPASEAGVLKVEGNTGKLTEVSDDPDDDEPLLVTVPGGATWWYQHGQLVRVVGAQRPEKGKAKTVMPASAASIKLSASSLAALADSDESEEEQEQEQVQLEPDSSDGENVVPTASNNARAGRRREALVDSEESEEEMAPAPPKVVPDTWQLVNRWLSVEFDGDSESASSGKSYHHGLVVDYDKGKGRHLLKWAETDTEEWVPALLPSEYSFIESRAEEKTTLAAVVFDNNVQLPPAQRPELAGSVYKVAKPANITVGPSR